MLYKLSLVLAAVLLANIGVVPAGAQTPIDYDYNTTSGDWDSIGNWDPPGVPGENDTATIKANQTCTLDADAKARILTIEDGGTAIIDGSNLRLTLGKELLSGEDTPLVIEDGGSLQIEGFNSNAAHLDLYGDITIDGDPAIFFGVWGQINLFADVTLNGTGTLEGGCGSTALQAEGATHDFIISSNVTVKNLGRTMADEFVNNGKVVVDCGGHGESFVFEILGHKAYGTGTWEILEGTLKSDDNVYPIWSTPGAAGEFIINGEHAKWIFGGFCLGFSDTLTFKRGTFEFRVDLLKEYRFRNCGNFTFGQDAAGTMVIDVTAENSFEVGGTCE